MGAKACRNCDPGRCNSVAGRSGKLCLQGSCHHGKGTVHAETLKHASPARLPPSGALSLRATISTSFLAREGAHTMTNERIHHNKAANQKIANQGRHATRLVRRTVV